MIKLIGYPNGKKRQSSQSKLIQKGNLGQSLENDLNLTNKYYLAHQLALVHKKPTPITVVEVDYPKRSAAQITKAFYQLPSTTDYNGVYKGIYIDFEAKQTNNKTRIPLSMIHAHQLEHLNQVGKHGGFAFLIIRFTQYNETYFVEYSRLQSFLNQGHPKSIPYEWIKENCSLIPYSFLKPCDYLAILETYIKE